MSKRARFVIVSLILGLALWLVSFVSVDYRFGLLLAVAAVAYILSVWVLFEDLKGIEWVTLLILPVLFTLGVGLFGNFLPDAMPSMFGRAFQLETSILLASVFKVIYYLAYVMGMYGILLIENIFSVASIRTIQLFRAAKSASFVFTLVTSLFFYTMSFSLRIAFWWVGLISFVVTFILAYANFWSVDLKTPSYKEIWRFSIVSSWMVTMVSMVLSFWPLKPFMGGLMLTSTIYALLGVLEQRLSNRVYMEGLVEYGLSFMVIVLIGFLTTSWLGI